MTGSPANWNADREDELRKLWAQGYSASQIAYQLGCISRNAVIGKIHRLGIQRRKAPAPRKCVEGVGIKFRWTDDRDDHLAQMFQSGMDDDEIAAKLGTSNWSVISRRKVLRMLRQKPPKDPKVPKAKAPRHGKGKADPTPVVELSWSPLPGVSPVRRVDAKSLHCKWPITVDGDELSFCCGAIAADGSYCPTHYRKSVAPHQPKAIKEAKRRFWQSHAVKIHGRAA